MRRKLVVISVLALAGCSSTAEQPQATQSSVTVSSSESSASQSQENKPFSDNPTLAECRGLMADNKEQARATAEDCIRAIPAEDLAGSLLAVGVTDYDQAERAVDLGVRHLFLGTGTDFSMLNGHGDPARSLASLQERAGGELVISVDEEGGLVQRLSDVTGELASAQKMAQEHTPEQVRGIMFEHGKKLRDLGFTMDFAPVLDLAGGENIEDNAIGSRAFSADPTVVADYATAYSQGLMDAGITPVMKHFPGHGHATGDSHMGTVTAPPREEMEAADMVPFAELSRLPGMAAMVGHMQTPGIDGEGTEGAQTPASLNPAVYQLLRTGGYSPGARGGAAAAFNGPIFTDDLTGMKAVTDSHPGPEAAVVALQAGADQALTAAGAISVDDTVAAVRQAIVDGKISAEHVHEATIRAHLS